MAAEVDMSAWDAQLVRSYTKFAERAPHLDRASLERRLVLLTEIRPEGTTLCGYEQYDAAMVAVVQEALSQR